MRITRNSLRGVRFTKKYMTAQRQLLLSFLREHSDQQFSVEELAEQLCNAHDISISSIYRNVNHMYAEGLVQRFSVSRSRQYLYQYLGEDACSTHMHLKCEQCGQIYHMDDKLMEVILASTMQNDNFEINVQKTILYGSCKNCN